MKRHSDSLNVPLSWWHPTTIKGYLYNYRLFNMNITIVPFVNRNKSLVPALGTVMIDPFGLIIFSNNFILDSYSNDDK